MRALMGSGCGWALGTAKDGLYGNCAARGLSWSCYLSEIVDKATKMVTAETANHGNVWYQAMTLQARDKGRGCRLLKRVHILAYGLWMKVSRNELMTECPSECLCRPQACQKCSAGATSRAMTDDSPQHLPLPPIQELRLQSDCSYTSSPATSPSPHSPLSLFLDCPQDMNLD